MREIRKIKRGVKALRRVTLEEDYLFYFVLPGAPCVRFLLVFFLVGGLVYLAEGLLPVLSNNLSKSIPWLPERLTCLLPILRFQETQLGSKKLRRERDPYEDEEKKRANQSSPLPQLPTPFNFSLWLLTNFPHFLLFMTWHVRRADETQSHHLVLLVSFRGLPALSHVTQPEAIMVHLASRGGGGIVKTGISGKGEKERICSLVVSDSLLSFRTS